MFAGVMIVSPRALGLRLGGVGGLLKVGEEGSEELSAGSGDGLRGSDVVDAARPVCRDAIVFTARFLRFLARLPGVPGR